MTSIRSSIVATAADARGAFPRTSLIPPTPPSGPQESGRSFSAGAQCPGANADECMDAHPRLQVFYMRGCICGPVIHGCQAHASPVQQGQGGNCGSWHHQG